MATDIPCGKQTGEQPVFWGKGYSHFPQSISMLKKEALIHLCVTVAKALFHVATLGAL